MKLRHFFFAAMLIGGFAACSDEENLGGVDSGSSEVNAYMTLQIVGPQGSLTKTTPGEDKTQVGTSEENTISSVTVLLCDPTTKAVSYAHYINSGLTSIPDGVQTPVFPATVGTFEVYVVANPPAALRPSGSSLSVDVDGYTIEGITQDLMQSTYAANNTFMMFNECNASDDTDGASITISGSNDYDHPATCETIELDRLAVKIVSKAKTDDGGVDISGITTGPDAEFNAISSVTLQGFKLVNGATKVNLQQKWTNTLEGQGTAYPWFNLLSTPVLDADASTDATRSPGYYNHLSDFRTITVASGVYTAAKDDYADVTYYVTDDTDAPIYCMENNPTYNGASIVEARNGNTTGLIYQWKATLTENASDGYAGSNGFYWYGGTYYSKLEDIQKDYPNVFEKATGADAQAKLAAAKDELQTAYNSGTVDQDKMSDFRAKYKIKVYVDGIMYYTYFIKDQNYISNAGDVNSHYYSVMRNTIYDLKVTALNGIGTDIPGGWNPDVDPEDPVDPTNVYMVVQATVNPWVVSSEDITLD